MLNKPIVHDACTSLMQDLNHQLLFEAQNCGMYRIAVANSISPPIFSSRKDAAHKNVDKIKRFIFSHPSTVSLPKAVPNRLGNQAKDKARKPIGMQSTDTIT